MERIISLDSIKAAMTAAYDKYKQAPLPEGAAADPRVASMNVGRMGLSLRLVDGRRYDVGDTQALFAMGTILRIPLLAQLLTQNTPQELVQKMHPCGCGKCKCDATKPKGVHAKNIRLVSVVEPAGDPEGKMDALSSMMTQLMGSSPVLDDSLYKAAAKAAADAGVENQLAQAGYALYDDAPLCIDIAAKLDSMLVSTGQLAHMGATIAADGVNPETGIPAFDGSNAAHIVAMMAAKGPKKMKKQWLVITGVPAMTGFGGGMVAVVPGFGSLAAFSPELIGGAVPARAARALKEVVTSLGINVFGSARVKAE